MTFVPEKVSEFLTLFESVKEKIRSFNGCEHLELLTDVANSSVYFTHSHWISEDALNTYRQSELFCTTWEQTKKMFSGKPEAWSLKRV